LIYKDNKTLILRCLSTASSQAVRRAWRHRAILTGTSQHDDAHQRTSATVRPNYQDPLDNFPSNFP